MKCRTTGAIFVRWNEEDDAVRHEWPLSDDSCQPKFIVATEIKHTNTQAIKGELLLGEKVSVKFNFT